MKKKLMDRRMFARGLVLAPLGLAAASPLLAQMPAQANAAVPVALPPEAEDGCCVQQASTCA